MKRTIDCFENTSNKAGMHGKLHASQKALVKRSVKSDLEGLPVIVASATGTGKTDMANAICKQLAKHWGWDRFLAVLVTTDAAQAKKLGRAFGSMYMNGFHFGNAAGVRKALADGPVHVTMTSRYFKEHLLGLEDKALSIYEQSFIGPTAPSKVVFVLDEIESYKRDGWHSRLKKMRKTSSVPVSFLGLSATPGESNAPSYLNIFGQAPQAQRIRWAGGWREPPPSAMTRPWTQQARVQNLFCRPQEGCRWHRRRARRRDRRRRARRCHKSCRPDSSNRAPPHRTSINWAAKFGLCPKYAP